MNIQESKSVLVTYANSTYVKSAKALEKRASSIGFSDIRIFGPGDLSPEFISNNRDTLGFPRGSGYWIWKPAIIETVLNSMEDEQTLLYCDAGVMLRSKASYFEELSRDGSIHLWSPQSHKGTNNFWIEKHVWEEIVGEKKIINGLHYWAGLILGRNNESFRTLVGIWLDLCQKEYLLRPDSFKDYSPSTGLIGHRHDQSILNCLVHKNPTFFNLHSFNSNSRISPVIIHRRGNIKSYPRAIQTVLLGRIYRKLLNCLPRQLRHLIFRIVTQRRRPYVSKDEIQRHLDLFLL